MSSPEGQLPKSSNSHDGDAAPAVAEQSTGSEIEVTTSLQDPSVGSKTGQSSATLESSGIHRAYDTRPLQVNMDNHHGKDGVHKESKEQPQQQTQHHVQAKDQELQGGEETRDALATSVTSEPHPPPTATSTNAAVEREQAEITARESRQEEQPDGFVNSKESDLIDLSSSVVTLKPSRQGKERREEQEEKEDKEEGEKVDTSSKYLNPEPANYLDPTPPTPTILQSPSRSSSTAARSDRSDELSPSRIDLNQSEDKRYMSDDEQDGGSRSELQSIMEQFSEYGTGPGAEEVMSPRLEIASPTFSTSSLPQHPPRKSSLEPLTTSLSNQLGSLRMVDSSPASTRSRQLHSEESAPPVPPKDGTFSPPSRSNTGEFSSTSSKQPSAPLHRPPPPEPEPESALPFDFHRFLEQLRNKKADPVARYLKSFLSEFGKRQWMVHEQVKIIGDFLAFIANKMAQCDVWRDVPDAEFDNAREGMEKLVMNRLYSQTFSPAIQPPKPVPGAKPKRKGGDPPLGPGRRGQHQEDVERDNILSQKINIYGWVRESHLDIPAVGDSGKKFLKLAQQELLKIKSYRAPRDKIICVLNCCKVIFGLLKHNKSDSSADSFVPLLIYIVLQSNPEHLISNLQYILRFRNQDKLVGEAGYYLSSLMGATQFIEALDRTSLTITDDEFEKNVEAAVSAIAEKHAAESPVLFKGPQARPDERHHPLGLSAEGQEQARRQSFENEGTENPAIAGLLKTFQKPLSNIGRLFSDDAGPSQDAYQQHLASLPPRSDLEDHIQPSKTSSKHALSAEEAAARQVSAETAEAQKLQRAEHANVVETLASMFPDLDKDIISDVVHQKEGRVGLAVDACLALSS